MQIRTFGIPLLTLALGFGLTRLGSSPPVPLSAPAPPRTHSVASTPGPREADLPSPPLGPGHASRHRPETSSAGSEQRVVIPVNVASAILRKSTLGYSDFQSLKNSMDTALTMLGVAEKDRKEVQSLAQQAADDILREEKTRIKVARAEPAVIALDLSGMSEPSARIAGRLQDALFNVLPRDVAQVIVDGVNWDQYYPHDQRNEATFTIERTIRGSLMANMSAGSGIGFSIDESKYKDDGTPIPADRIFQDRWRPFLTGQTLVSEAHRPPQ